MKRRRPPRSARYRSPMPKSLRRCPPASSSSRCEMSWTCARTRDGSRWYRDSTKNTSTLLGQWCRQHLVGGSLTFGDQLVPLFRADRANLGHDLVLADLDRAILSRSGRAGAACRAWRGRSRRARGGRCRVGRRCRRHDLPGRLAAAEPPRCPPPGTRGSRPIGSSRPPLREPRVDAGVPREWRRLPRAFALRAG